MSRFGKVWVVVALPVLVVFLACLMPTAATSGNPHFVGADITKSGNTLTVQFKEAGLGNEPQVHIVITAQAQCINPGGNHPKADNKEAFTAAGDFPVQNGKAEGDLSLTAVMKPDCTPPMTLVFSEVTITDVTSGITKTFPGTY